MAEGAALPVAAAVGEDARLDAHLRRLQQRAAEGDVRAEGREVGIHTVDQPRQLAAQAGAGVDGRDQQQMRDEADDAARALAEGQRDEGLALLPEEGLLPFLRAGQQHQQGGRLTPVEHCGQGVDGVVVDDAGHL